MPDNSHSKWRVWKLALVVITVVGIWLTVWYQYGWAQYLESLQRHHLREFAIGMTIFAEENGRPANSEAEVARAILDSRHYSAEEFEAAIAQQLRAFTTTILVRDPRPRFDSDLDVVAWTLPSSDFFGGSELYYINSEMDMKSVRLSRKEAVDLRRLFALEKEIAN